MLSTDKNEPLKQLFLFCAVVWLISAIAYPFILKQDQIISPAPCTEIAPDTCAEDFALDGGATYFH